MRILLGVVIIGLVLISDGICSEDMLMKNDHSVSWDYDSDCASKCSRSCECVSDTMGSVCLGLFLFSLFFINHWKKTVLSV